MMTYGLRIDLTFTASGPEDGDGAFDAFTDRVMDELHKLEELDPGLLDPDLVGSIAERSLSISMGVQADSRRDAERLFLANVRTALHAAECGTASWPGYTPVGQVNEACEADLADA